MTVRLSDTVLKEMRRVELSNRMSQACDILDLTMDELNDTYKKLHKANTVPAAMFTLETFALNVVTRAAEVESEIRRHVICISKITITASGSCCTQECGLQDDEINTIVFHFMKLWLNAQLNRDKLYSYYELYAITLDPSPSFFSEKVLNGEAYFDHVPYEYWFLNALDSIKGKLIADKEAAEINLVMSKALSESKEVRRL